MNKIAITTGDPNGIGAEITIKALNKLDIPTENIVILSNKKIINFYGILNKNYEILEIPFPEDVSPGKQTAGCGEFSYQSLKKACEISPKAIVTSPVAKSSMHLANRFYNGQTEILQKFLAKENQSAEMLFVAKDYRVLLLTRHCALKEISITKNIIIEKISKLNNFFTDKLNIQKPKFALCALNPHAGENGILGNDEIDYIIPAVKELQANGIEISMPLPADTLFINASQNYLKNEPIPNDCYIAMYHDQGLIPIKSVASANTVNMTIGLDIIRTSPCHGTAFDIAGKNIADETSMVAAIRAVL